MGLLVEGVWQDKWYDTKKSKGHFVRTQTQFRNWITKDGSPGPTGEGGFKAEKDRYHLYVSYACPWASRALIFRKIKGLEDIISLSVVHPYMGENGWTFEEGDGVIPDTVHQFDYLYQVYLNDDPKYTGRVTVPVLFDKKQDRIVSNESADIIRMFNSAFDDLGAKEGDYYPEELREEIDEINELVYHNVNNGVYKAGFATKQEVYEAEVRNLFTTLDKLEERLIDQDYLVGNTLTEADWRLFTTLIRFEPVYFGHFKCNLKHLTDYPNLWNYTKRLYNYPGVSETVNFDHIKRHYYMSHPTINPNQIVPLGPDLDYTV
ncbi:glutathione S-transferase family protein [Ignavigranum ruoffiae]|uniref:glutathione S-transferase family protein n=1 Tax=Ignavigranum ruoffiae TaxID=89093 RepID=UPI0020571B2C|nr:glutathione S-transferase family protein [Ignavigranum ruoffiae]UPQ85066.1 glutathione S-transferase family protein [Ignavigranum ruoffiae]